MNDFRDKERDSLPRLLRDVVSAFNTAFALRGSAEPIFVDEDECDSEKRKDLLCWRAIQLAVYTYPLISNAVENDEPWAVAVCESAYPMFDEPIVDKLILPTIDHDLRGTDTLRVEETRSLREWEAILGHDMPSGIYLDGVLDAIASAANRRVGVVREDFEIEDVVGDPLLTLQSTISRLSSVSSTVDSIYEFQRPAQELNSEEHREIIAQGEELKRIIMALSKSLAITRIAAADSLGRMLGQRLFSCLAESCRSSLVSAWLLLMNPELRDGALITVSLAKAIEAELMQKVWERFAKTMPPNYSFIEDGKVTELGFGRMAHELREDVRVRQFARQHRIDPDRISRMIGAFTNQRNRACHSGAVSLDEGNRFWKAVLVQENIFALINAAA